MWYKIKQGRHRAYPLSLGIHTGKTSESYEVIFDDSCRYILEGTDKEDTNKLFGWSYGILPWRKQITFTGAKTIGDTEIFEWRPAHHKESIRVGWKYNSTTDMIDISRYVYLNGYRYDHIINSVEIGKKNIISMNYSIPTLEIKVNDDVDSFPYVIMNKTWGYNLGVYFGGRNDITGKDNVAPHDMKVWIKRLKKY